MMIISSCLNGMHVRCKRVVGNAVDEVDAVVHFAALIDVEESMKSTFASAESKAAAAEHCCR